MNAIRKDPPHYKHRIYEGDRGYYPDNNAGNGNSHKLYAGGCPMGNMNCSGYSAEGGCAQGSYSCDANYSASGPQPGSSGGGSGGTGGGQQISQQQMDDTLLHFLVKYLIKFPQRAIIQLKKFNFYINNTPSTEELISATAHALGRSKGFAKAIVMDIITMEKNKQLSAAGEAYYGPDGTDTSGSKPLDIGSLLSGGASLINSVGDLFGGKKRADSNVAKSNAQAQDSAAQAKLAEEATKQKMLDLAAKASGAGAQKSAGSKIGLYIGIGIAVIAVAGGIFAFVKLTHKRGGTATASQAQAATK